MECKIVDACHYDADFILDLNQRFTPAVSDLSNDMMTYFLEISDYFKVLKVDRNFTGWFWENGWCPS